MNAENKEPFQNMSDTLRGYLVESGLRKSRTFSELVRGKNEMRCFSDDIEENKRWRQTWFDITLSALESLNE